MADIVGQSTKSEQPELSHLGQFEDSDDSGNKRTKRKAIGKIELDEIRNKRLKYFDDI